MSQVTMPCTCCGLLLEFPPETALLTCPACGTRNAPPRVAGETLITLQRATEQRQAADFHNAELSYQQVLLYRPDAHEALWGRLLCHYGVEYVEDPATKRRMPTVHTVRPRGLQSQSDFIKACKQAPEAIRRQYEQDAAYIDAAQADIRQKAESCPPYDVFLCHKTTKPGSKEKTEDFHRATQLYHFLKDQGVRVFFAPECLQDIAGANYEAGIYHALHTAKIMLLICSEPEYLTSPWVRSEWSRYLTIMEQEPEKKIIPLLYDHFDPDNLPPQFLFHNIQGMDMEDINARQRLLEITNAGAVVQETKKKKGKKPQANAEDMVTLVFPGLQKRWKNVPKWFILDSDKDVIAAVEWNSSVQIELLEERVQLFYAGAATKAGFIAAGIIADLLLLAALVIMLCCEADYELASFITMIPGTILSLFFFTREARPRIYGEIVVEKGNTYDLSWRLFGRNKFKARKR